MATEEYSIGYQEGLQAGWNEAMDSQTAQRKPLNHEQRLDLLIKFKRYEPHWDAPAILIDLIEAAHGIKE